MRFVFYPAQSGKPWNGATIYQEALGGSETAVVYMAKELAKLGHEVIVFARGEPGVYDDVVYLPFASARSLLLTMPVDILVCARDPIPITWSTRATAKVFWAHDMPQGPLPDFDLYFMVSQWQANAYVGNGFVPKEKVKISPNGVDLSLYPTPDWTNYPSYTADDDPILIWTSNPERGLWHAGRIFQQVRKAFPRAGLYVYGRNSIYGWGMEYEHNFHPDKKDMEEVAFLSSKNKKLLADKLITSDLLFYPTWWPETFCINALEAQAAGVPVVSTNYGALSETVRGGVLIPGRPGEGDYDAQCAEAVIDLLEDGEARKLLALDGRQYAETLGWDAHAKAWNQLFNSAMGLSA